MARKTADKRAISGIEKPIYWQVGGRNVFRLDLPDFRDQLFVDICAVVTLKRAEDWISERGHLVNAIESAQTLLTRAASVRYLRDLNVAVRQSENDQHQLLDAWSKVFEDETYCPPGYPNVTIDFPPREWGHDQPAFDFADEHYRHNIDQIAYPVTLYTVPLQGRCISAQYHRNPHRAKREAARFILKQGVQMMTAGVSISLTSTEFNGEWILVPFNTVATPWQAIGLAAMKLICAESFNQRFCRNPNCRAPIVGGRADKEYCDRQYCQKWGRKNLGSVRG